MAKKSKDYKANKGNKEIKASSSIQPRDQKSGQGRGVDNETGKWQTSQGNKLADAQKSQGMSLPEGQENQGIDLPEVITTKKGCLPKLVVLLLPFVAIGAFWFLRS
ncbi:MAG: hypothetical protein WCF08_04680 [Anaerolineaceae bacterium]